MLDADVIIIGSGPAGSHVAYPLLESGARVLMIDGGRKAPSILEEEPGGTYEDLRVTCIDQYRWLLGEDCSGIPLSSLGSRPSTSMAGGNRSYVWAGVEAVLPILAKDAEILQSLAIGGLAAIWGAVCAYYKESTLIRMGLPPSQFQRHYEVVTKRVGIASPPCSIEGVLPPLQLDNHGKRLLQTAFRKQSFLRKLDVTITQPPMAVLTEARANRRACGYTALEYYTDAGRAVYRPQFTIEELSNTAGFTYRGGLIAERIQEGGNATVLCRSMEKDVEKTSFTARCIILASGAIGTARILTRTLRMMDQRLPFLSKPHSITACLHLPTLGNPGETRRSSLCQLMAIARGKDDADSVCSQLYSYSAFPLFRLLPSLPIPVPHAFRLMALLAPSLVLADTRMPHLQPNGTVRLSSHEDRMVIETQSSTGERETRARQLKHLTRAFRSMLLFPLRTVQANEGSSFHYAGTVPIAEEGYAPITAEGNGKVRGLHRTFVCDASLFRILPALPHTLTIMANAHRIGEEVRLFLFGDH